MPLTRINANGISDGTVVAADIANGSVSSAKLAGNLIFDGIATFLDGSLERANIISSAPLSISNVNYYDGGVHYYTANAAANGAITLNVNGLSAVNTGNIASLAVLLTNNATFNAYISAFRVDNIAANVLRWQSTPTSGSANIDIYTFNIIKTAAGAYTVLGSRTNFS